MDSSSSSELVGWLEKLNPNISWIGFESGLSLTLFVLTLLFSALVYGGMWLYKDSDNVSDEELTTLKRLEALEPTVSEQTDYKLKSGVFGTSEISALVVLTVCLLITRHILVLMGQAHVPFNWAIVLVLLLIALFASLTATGSLIFAVASFLTVLFCGLVRFGDHSSDWYSGLTRWFASEYFPYDVTPDVLTTGVLVFVICSLYSLHTLRVLNERRKKAVLSGDNYGIDPVAIEKLAAIASVVIGLLLAMAATGVSIPTITVITGLLAAGIGFAAKDVLSNIAAGVVLLWDGSFKVDDVISIDGGGYGWIDKLTLRHAVIKDRNDVSILVPYTKLIGSNIQNWTHGSNTVRLKIDIGIDYDADVSIAKEVLTRATRISNERILDDPSIKVTVIAAGASAIQLQVRFWINDPKEGIRNVMSDVLQSIISELKAANIRIPYDTLDVNLKTESHDGIRS